MLRPRCLLYVMIAAWLMTWIITVPLFHVHLPDTTDRWSALQSGGIHTVFTPALPGEYSPPVYDHDHFGHLSQRAVNSPELGFTLLSDTDEGQRGKQLSLLVVYDDNSSVPLSSWPFEFSGTYRGPPLSYGFPAFRAPPRIVST